MRGTESTCQASIEQRRDDLRSSVVVWIARVGKLGNRKLREGRLEPLSRQGESKKAATLYASSDKEYPLHPTAVSSAVLQCYSLHRYQLG